MRRFSGLSLVLVAGCLDLNPVFVEPQGSEGGSATDDDSEGPVTSDDLPTTTPPPPTEGSASGEPPGTDTDVGTSSTTMPPGVCGDGVVNPGEACDDGDDDQSDECLSGCQPAVCGDGELWLGVEACDDGNQIDTDDCPSTCNDPVCGDGFVYKDFEACDDGNMVDNDSCYMCKPAKCGDFVIQDGVEKCDDGNELPDDGCEPDCTPSVRLVFVTSKPFMGDLGGLGGADKKCEDLAAMAGLPMTSYRAWLSDQNQWPAKFMKQYDFPYVKVNGEKVADNWMGLVSGNLLSPIDVNEKGGAPPALGQAPCPGYSVHTNTTAQGTQASGEHCSNWLITEGTTTGGSSAKKDGQWTQVCNPAPCDFPAPIYCVQQ